LHPASFFVEGTAIKFVQGWAKSDPEQRHVSVATPDGDVTLGYDYLTYAIGSGANTTTVAGADAAFTLDNPRTATALGARLAGLEPGGMVAVCGNGLTGLEAATGIAESHPHLRVVLLGRDEPVAAMGAKARAHVAKVLDRLGVEVRSGVEIIKVLPDFR
jgi:NADH dehydrogenase FAD-containing subunit